jgi:hypothetical protein
MTFARLGGSCETDAVGAVYHGGMIAESVAMQKPILGFGTREVSR